jgi:hypothetical protein
VGTVLLFIYDLFNNAVCISNCLTLNGEMIIMMCFKECEREYNRGDITLVAWMY